MHGPPAANAARPPLTRAQRLLEAPVLPTIGRLAMPAIVLAACQTTASIADSYFIGMLGTDALAGLALVFPLVMLLQMTSAGAMGGGVSSAIARALGADDERLARNLVAHAIAIAVAVGLLFTLAVLALGRPLYSLLGGRDAALAQALVYSQLLFGGAVCVWLANTLASVMRGSGDTLRPALVLAIAAALQIPLTGALTLGWGGLPALGIAGPAVAYVATFGLAALAMALHLRPTRLWPRGADWRLRRGPAVDILRVGAVSSLAAVQTVITAVVLTGLVARFGTAALAGYGVGVRLELLLVPIVFAIGQALVLMVGLAIGAGRVARARKVAWTGAAVAFALTLAIGGFVALFPQSWVGLFSQDAAVLDAGAHYLRIVGPFYPLFGAGMALYFASQGAGRVVFPVLAGTVRLVFVLSAGALAVSWDRPVGELFAIIAIGLVLFGVFSIIAVRRTRWGRA